MLNNLELTLELEKIKFQEKPYYQNLKAMLISQGKLLIEMITEGEIIENK